MFTVCSSALHILYGFEKSQQLKPNDDNDAYIILNLNMNSFFYSDYYTAL